LDRSSVGWRGNFTAVITPFTRDGQVDRKLFMENIELLITEGIDGIIIAGCTGEFWALTGDERTSLFKWGKEAARGRVPVIASISQMTAIEVFALGKAAERLGMDGCMLTPPAAVVPVQKDLYEYFRWIADACALPMMVYNIPRRLGVGMSPAFLASLAAIPNVVGIKQSTSDFLELLNTIRLAKDKLLVFAGRPINWGFPAAVMGADGFVSSDDPQLVGREAAELYAKALSGRLEECCALQTRLMAINAAVHDFGTSPAGLKAAMNLRGRPGGYPRRPVLPIEGQPLEELRASLQGLGLLG
jgi:4-hydroxy-tetrahydrodipicolinate synthase